MLIFHNTVFYVVPGDVDVGQTQVTDMHGGQVHMHIVQAVVSVVVGGWVGHPLSRHRIVVCSHVGATVGLRHWS